MFRFLKEHRNKRKKPFKCNVCDVSFFPQAKLKLHIVSAHEIEKTFICNVCDASFAQKGN